MLKLGVHCVRRAVSGSVTTDFGKVAYASLLLVLSCALSPAFAQASAGCTPAEGSGTSSSPYRIATLCELQGISLSPAAHYLLVDSIDASTATSFEPIASTATDGFSGSFVNASDHVISSLTISRSAESNVGLFSRLAAGATIRGIILAGSRTTGRDNVGSLVGSSDGGAIEGCSATGSVFGRNGVGGLVGHSRGDISGSYVKGSVSGDDYVGGLVGSGEGGISGSYVAGSVSGDDVVGGLVGNNSDSGSINDSYAASTVTGTDGVGGLAGSHGSPSSIRDSYATGFVFGNMAVGGLVGDSAGEIIDSYATGSVSGQNIVGGLVGYQGYSSRVRDSYAMGSVSGESQIGGLVGRGIDVGDSYATGFISGNDYVGGLMGYSRGHIGGSYATGFVSGNDDVGGLVGYQGYRSSIRDIYATGSVFGQSFVGGLVGESEGNINNGYATGFVSGVENIGGLVGLHTTARDTSVISTSTVRNSYYAARGRNNGLGEERTFVQLRCPTVAGATCPPGSRESIYEGWDTKTWDFGSARDLPQLLGNKNPDLNRKPYIKGSTELVVVGFTGITRFSLEAGYLGFPEDPVIFTWSLFGVPPSLLNLVYFDLDGTSGTEANGSVATLSVVGDMRLAGKSFYVVLKNNVSVNDDRIQVRIAGASPLVDSGRDQVGTIQASLLSNILSFSATDSDSPYSGGAGLSWSFSSRDIAEDSTVRFNGSTGGGTVEVEVVRPLLDFYGVGSFVLEVESPAGVKTTLTVTIETVCSTELGEDLMAGQTGAGTSDNPYRIERLCQLQDVSSSPSAYYELATNIDASRTKDWNRGAGFEPIALYASNGFEGSFVSTGNYVISSLKISRSDTDNAGLFSRLARDATIRGVILVDSHMTGRDIVGSLVGFNAGVIEDCSAAGSIISGGNQVGGLVGRNEEGASVSRSYAANTVAGQSNVGGLVGFQATASSIRDSYATGSASGSDYVGGLVGFQATASSIRDSYATGSAFGQGSSVGGLVGGRQGLSLSVGNSYYVARGRSNGLGKERTFEQLRCPTMASVTCPPGSLESTYEGWNPGVWDFGTADELPQLLSNFNPGLSRKLLRVKMYLGGAVR